MNVETTAFFPEKVVDMEAIERSILSQAYEALTPHVLEHGVHLERMNIPAEIQECDENGDGMIGTPEKDMECFHEQESSGSCAIACQEFVAEQLLGEEFTEKEIADIAELCGWYSRETGTLEEDVGKLLELLGCEVEQYDNYTLQELAEDLESGKKVICTVNSFMFDKDYSLSPGLQRDHAVQVIGIDCRDPDNIEVILNDPGRIDGMGCRVSLGRFDLAWSASQRFAVVVGKGVA